jgi:hypothetical protein
MFGALTILAACSNTNKNISTTGNSVHKEIKKDTEVSNIKEVIKVIKDKNPKFKLAVIGDSGDYSQNQLDVVQACLMSTGNNRDSGDDSAYSDYGYDQNNVGTSVDAFAIKNKLSKTQADFIYEILTASQDTKGVKAGFNDTAVGFAGLAQKMIKSEADSRKIKFDYLTVKDLKIKNYNNPTIVGKYIIHFKNDGISNTQTINMKSNIHKEIETKINQHKKFTQADKKFVLRQAKMNLDAPQISNDYSISTHNVPSVTG